MAERFGIDFRDLADQVRPFGVPFIHVPAGRDIRQQAEQRQLELLRGNVDLVLLARYMQILTPHFLAEVGCPLINIHHSFLRAFIGVAPYRRAKERGVKLPAPPRTMSLRTSMRGWLATTITTDMSSSPRRLRHNRSSRQWSSVDAISATRLGLAASVSPLDVSAEPD